MAELRVTSTGTIKLFESDDTSSVTIASPASLGGDRTVTLPDANVDLTQVNTMPIANLDIDGGTDIGADIVDADLFIIDDGAGGTNRKTTASRIKTYIGSPSFAGIDDQSSSNDDQLTITDTAVVINEDSDDVDFRVESNGNANMLVVNAGGDRVGIGSDPDLGVGLHIKIADTGASASANADELVIEGTASGGNEGISILSATDGTGQLVFGDSGDNDIGRVYYNHSNNYLALYANGSERMRLISNGTVLVGATATLDMDDTNNGIKFDGANDLVQLSRNNNAAFAIQRTGNNGRVAQFYRETTERGYIEVDGSSTNYVTSSDYRLKENIVDLDNGITRLKQLKPRRFNFIGQEDTRDGFVAHEVTAVPEAVSGEKDAVDENGKVIQQGLDQSKIVPLLTAALQEAVTKIETLEAKVKTLEEA